jgi:hypothetical protein
MMGFRGAVAGRQIVILLSVAVAACNRDSATGPVSSNADSLRLEAVSPTQVEGIVGEPVNLVPTVVVRNLTGQAVPGIRVIFNALHGSESVVGDYVTNRIVTTDYRGVASPGNWTLGTVTGLHGLEARILDEHFWSAEVEAHRVVAFHAAAKAAAAAALSKELFSGDTVGLAGDELSPPIVRVVDRFGNDVGGVAITFSVTSGGGSLAKTRDESSRFGSASPGAWTMGPHPGLNSVVANAPGLNSVTFSARALDVGAITWYDLVPQSVRLIVSGSIALCEDGTFELVTVETSDAFPGEWFERQFGKYTVTGTVVALTFSTGVIEQGTLVDESLSFVHKKPNWVNYPPEDWRFAKRRQSNAAVAGF